MEKESFYNYYNTRAVKYGTTNMKTIDAIEREISTQRQELLEDYTNWLCKKGYTDSDVYTEKPRAVDAYLQSLLKTSKKI